MSQRQFSHQSQARGGSENGAPSLAGSFSSCQGEMRRSRTGKCFLVSTGPAPSWNVPAPGAESSQRAPGALSEGQCPQEVTGSSAEQMRHYKNKNGDKEGCRDSSSSLFSCEMSLLQLQLARRGADCHFISDLQPGGQSWANV